MLASEMQCMVLKHETTYGGEAQPQIANQEI